MAAAEKILDLIRSYSENNEGHFYAIAMQIAASEARKGHTKVAQELKQLVEKAKSQRNMSAVSNLLQHPASKEFKDIDDLVEVTEHKRGLGHMVLHSTVRDQLGRLIREQQKFDELRLFNLIPRRKAVIENFI